MGDGEIQDLILILKKNGENPQIEFFFNEIIKQFFFVIYFVSTDLCKSMTTKSSPISGHTTKNKTILI